MIFSGSYHRDDVEFLLKPISVEPIADVAQKERLIQSGVRHYSEMLSPEALPSSLYLNVFQEACTANRERMARDCLALAALISERRPEAITLVSLARAGTPVGVIVKHLLAKVFNRTVSHFSVSIIRDRGIDEVALNHILARGHSPESIVFVDGWTGKGVISRELEQAINRFNQHHNVSLDSGLYVLSDLAGTAACAASCEDYLIPSSILNATVSGLVSRSVLNESIGEHDFHGCVYYKEFEPYDQSRPFSESLIHYGLDLVKRYGVPKAQAINRAEAARISSEYIHEAMALHGIRDVNMIKPGIGEATRVLLRRSPRLLIVRNPNAEQVAHLKILAKEKAVPLVVDECLPYQAVSLIKRASDA